MHPDLIPNARRDNFSETDTYYDFESKLQHFFHSVIWKLCYTASDVNSAVKAIFNYNQLVEQFEKKKEEGFIDKAEQKTFLENIEKKKEEAVKAEKKLETIKAKSVETLTPIAKIIERATSNHTLAIKNDVDTEVASKPVFRTAKLSRLNKGEQKFLGNIFSIIQNVLPKETAELLIQKIEEEYK